MVNPTRKYILHADMDAFYASIEQTDEPKYRGLPLVVGASASQRGVVAAASYEARKYGIRSAMPMKTAFKLYPDLIRVEPRFTRYRDISSLVMGIFSRLTPLVQPLSLDEAYLDISKQVPSDMKKEVAIGIKNTVFDKTGLTLTIGGGTSKTVAKIASQVAKPNGLLLIQPGQEIQFMHPLDVGLMWGVGPKTEQILHSNGIRKIGDISAKGPLWLQNKLGQRGIHLLEMANGKETDEVHSSKQTKSISSESTLSEDSADQRFLEEKLYSICLQVAQRLLNQGLKGKTVSLKLRLSDFTTFSRQKTLPSPTNEIEPIYTTCLEIFRTVFYPGMQIRLMGTSLSGFTESNQLRLI